MMRSKMDVIKSKMGTIGNKMGRKFEQKRKAKLGKEKKQIWSRPKTNPCAPPNNDLLNGFSC